MTTAKNAGIWMDHLTAHLTPFTTEPMHTTYVESGFTHLEKEQSLEKSEHHMHNKEQGRHAAYYKKLGEMIQQYEAVVLFGPTSAKVELFNILRTDQQFKKIRIDIIQADKMTENQEHALVRKHFSGRLIE